MERNCTETLQQTVHRSLNNSRGNVVGIPEALTTVKLSDTFVLNLVFFEKSAKEISEIIQKVTFKNFLDKIHLFQRNDLFNKFS